MATFDKKDQAEVSCNGSKTALPSRGQAPGLYPSVIEKYTSCRWRLSYMLTLAFTLVMMLRNCTSFAVVCMTGEAIRVRGDNFIEDAINNMSTELKLNSSNTTEEFVGEFDYNSETQGLIISSVYYAGIVSPIFGSYASRKFGPKRVTALFMTIGAVVTLLTPIAARTQLYLFILCRVIIGFSVTISVPISLDFWLFWAPLEEKAQLVAYAYSGFTLASVITFSISGLLCVIPVDNGWPFIFYIFGGCTLFWCIAWCLMIHEKPETHPSISAKEKSFIISTRSQMASESEVTKVPWKNILTSKGVWAYVIIFCSHTWTASVFLSYLPLYMATILKFDVRQNGILSSLPYVGRGLGTIVWGYISTKIARYTSVTNTRKIVQAVGYGCASVLSVALCYVGEGQEYIAVLIFIISTFFQAVIFNAGIVTPLDMAPQFASLISSFGTVFNVIAMILSPLTVSYIVKDRTREQWTAVLYINAAIYAFSALVFVIFGSGELQPWADNSRRSEKSVTHAEQTKGQLNASFVAEKDENTHM